MIKKNVISRKKLASLEEEIAYLEIELEDADRLLQNPELSTDWQALRTLHAQRQDISDHLDALLAKWVEISEILMPGSEKNL